MAAPGERAEEEEDAGTIGGGGPGATIPEYDDPDDEERHLPDTDHGER